MLNVLRHHHVDLSPDPLQPGNTLMVKGSVAISIPLDDWVKRKTTDLLKRKFAVPIHYFFRPEMMAFEAMESPENPN